MMGSERPFDTKKEQRDVCSQTSSLFAMDVKMFDYVMFRSNRAEIPMRTCISPSQQWRIDKNCIFNMVLSSYSLQAASPERFGDSKAATKSQDSRP